MISTETRAELFNATSLDDRTIHRRAIELAIWGMPAVSMAAIRASLKGDTSVDVYIGPTSPPGRESNWVQTWPGKGWSVILRLYGPLQPFFDKTWRPSEIQEVT